MMDFIDFARAHGLVIQNLDYGKITRCPTDSRRTKRNGAYYFEGEFGWCMDWQAHDKPQIWVTDKIVNPEEIQRKIKQSQIKYNQERARLNANAVKKATAMLSNCKQELSQYLASKGFPEMCFNMFFEDNHDPLLCIPMRIDKKISGMQVIKPDGSKKFIYGTNASMSTFDIGRGDNIFLCEGFATSLSLQAVLKKTKIPYMIRVCFSSGNMLKVSKQHKNPYLICDNDLSSTGQKVGIDSGCRFYLPENPGDDLNDEHLKRGLFYISQKIMKMFYTRL